MFAPADVSAPQAPIKYEIPLVNASKSKVLFCACSGLKLEFRACLEAPVDKRKTKNIVIWARRRHVQKTVVLCLCRGAL